MIRRPSLRHVLATTAGALGLAVASLAPVATADATSARLCDYDHSVYKIMGAGSIVWIGTNQYSAWTQGKTTITRTYTKTAGTSSSHGESDSVSGGVNWGVVSADYNHEWNRSTSSSTSWSNSWSYNIAIPAGVTARARLYHKGWSFPVRKTDLYFGGASCNNVVSNFHARVPIDRNNNDVYCYVRDSYPGTKVIGSCSNH